MKSKVIPQNFKSSNSLFYRQLQKKEKFSDTSFAGLSNNAEFFSKKIQYKRLCTKEKFSSVLELLEPCYKEYFKEISANLRDELKKNPHLFKDMPKEIKTYIADGYIIKMPEKSLAGRFTDAIFAPITYCYKSVKNMFFNKENLTNIKKVKQIKIDLANIEGLVEYSESLKGKNPQEVKLLIRDRIRKNFTKSKANYSSNLANTYVEIATLFVAAIYHGFDFYNLTRRVDDNHEEAMKEAKLKVKQDFIRLAIISYLTYVVTTLFKRTCNKSMLKMMAIASLIQLSAEIINRKITGRPILPLNNETLKAYKEKHNTNSQKSEKDCSEKSKMAKQQNPDLRAKKISFTGSPVNEFFSKKFIISKNDLQNIMQLTEKINPEQTKRYYELIEKKLSGELKGKKLNDIFSDNQITGITLGEKQSHFEKLIESIFIPITASVKFVKNTINHEKKKVDEFNEVKNYFAFVKRLLKTKYKDKDIIADKETFDGFRKDIMNASLGSFRVTEANYNNAIYAIVRRIFSYAMFISFIAADTYNVAMIHSDGDKKKASNLAKQRVAQDSTRFFISMYTSSSVLNILGDFYNRALANVFGLTIAKSTINNYLTRKVLNMPIKPMNKEQLDKFDQKHKNSYVSKFIKKAAEIEEN